MSKETININVPVLARVEGEGALDLVIDNDTITKLHLRIYEPPRYFEKFLEGRNYYDIPDTVARICGICPVAYQMSASHAVESIFGVHPTPWLRAMRRLFYCGEWLQSHSLHIHLLAAPDFLGFNSVIEMSADYGDEVRRGLKLQAIGNDLVALFGARSVHPVGVKIGGFTQAPSQAAVDALLQRVRDARQDAVDLVHWLDSLELPDDEQDFISVALHHDDEYPFNEGRLVSDHGLDIAVSEFENHFKEQHVDHSTALHCLLDGKPYLVGPLARLNLNAAQLPAEVQEVMRGLRAQFPSKNMFHSIIARGIEVLACIIEAEQLLANYTPTDEPCLPLDVRAGTGYACTEAPRGILWHRYDLDEKGIVQKAVIVPPTSQNQPRIEQDLQAALINFGLDQPKDALQLHAEKVIRNYDPCISCATHFLDLQLVRDGVAEQATLPSLDFQHADPARTAIIGIGSEQHGDDLGWQMLDRLAGHAALQPLVRQGLSLLKLDRPGLGLLDTLASFEHVLVIDALAPNQQGPAFIMLNPDQFRHDALNLSSHEAALPAVINLLGSLGELPAQLAVVGVRDCRDDFVDRITALF